MTEKILYDYSILIGKIKEVFKTNENFAKSLGIGQTSLSKRLNNKSEWSQEEMKKTLNLFNEPIYKIEKYFYTPLKIENTINSKKFDSFV